MKIKQKKISNYKLIKLNLLKSKIYKHINTDSLNIIINDIEISLQQSLKIILDYHISNHKILFINFPFLENLLKLTNHYFIEEKIWINGFFSNSISLNKHLKFKKLTKKFLSLKQLLDIKQRPDLVVILQHNIKLNMLKEFKKCKIPIILFGNNIKFDNKEILYKIPGNLNFISKKFNNIFNLILFSMFKRFLKISAKFIPKIFLKKKKINKKHLFLIYYYSKYKNKFFLKKKKKFFKYSKKKKILKNIKKNTQLKNERYKEYKK